MRMFRINAFGSDITKTRCRRMEESIVCTDRGIIIAGVSK